MQYTSTDFWWGEFGLEMPQSQVGLTYGATKKGHKNTDTETDIKAGIQ